MKEDRKFEKVEMLDVMSPDCIMELFAEKFNDMPQLEDEKDGVHIASFDIYIHEIGEGCVGYTMKVALFGKKTVEMAKEAEKLYGGVSANIFECCACTVLNFGGWPSKKKIERKIEELVDDFIEYYEENIYEEFKEDKNLALDVVRSKYDHETMIEELFSSFDGHKSENKCKCEGCCNSDTGSKDDFSNQSDKRVTHDEIEALMASAEVSDSKVNGNTTIVTMIFPSGWTMTEQSACIDPENYDHEIGMSLCKEHIKDRLWELEGYRKLHMYIDDKGNECEAEDENDCE